MDAPRPDPTSEPLLSNIMSQGSGDLRQHHSDARPPTLGGTTQPSLRSRGYLDASPPVHEQEKKTGHERGQTGNPLMKEGNDSSSRSIRSNPVRKRTGDTFTLVRANRTRSHLVTLLKPVSLLIAGAMLAIGHHLFNSWANGRTVYVSRALTSRDND
ncbi:hypothetical protein FRC01_009380 [Tulasnella sp. 417]|nr:hypothetical protein FRC01_009380 [Tulasnella sp. 417]